MADVLDVALSMLIGTLGPILFVAWDERRLSPAALERSWPISTRLSAALAFGPLCLPVHFFRTRRSILGTLAGLVVMLAFIGVIMGASELMHLVVD